MQIYNNHDLRPYNTFGISAKCTRFIVLESKDDIKEYFENIRNGNNIFILGGGSNILIVNDLDCDVLKINLKGTHKVDESSSKVIYEVMAGENWHQFVSFLVQNCFSGLENLALIPGNVGTAPIQNIGAYGVEQMQCFHSLNGFNIEKGIFETYYKEDCNFEYRSSVFKQSLKDKFIITSVKFAINKFEAPNTNYHEVASYLSDNNLKATTQNVFDAVVAIRQSKLPSPSDLGNSGSFFKNPIISEEQFNRIKTKHPELKGYRQDDGKIKISAGWLIEKSDLKGYRVHDAAVFDRHALILVNYGNASGLEIWNLAKHVIETVESKFEIKLEPEVNIVGLI
jgi:UDP-N-acetylmuramate dehydrogenase